MKIVILDTFTLNAGDLSWQALSELGELICYDRTLADEVVSRTKDADVILTNKVILSAEILSQLPQLNYIGVLATGTNIVDLDAASAGGIVVTNAPNYASDSVAQMVFAHILNYTQQVAVHAQSVKNNAWSTCPDFSFTLSPLHSLRHKVLGLIGYGDIGRKVAKIGLAFGMKVVVNTRQRLIDLPNGISWQTQDEIWANADFLSLHCPLTEATKQLINTASLVKMRSSTVLVNTSRGELIDEIALANALKQGQLAFAGLDVLSIEPPSLDHPFFKLKNICISPHNAWATVEARQRLLDIVVSNLISYVEGPEVLNRVV
ncbi:D-2-hydroxyacid dehydrogenase [Shewanella surugensis]|uniref:D-2-hydroxyacid dehydrogenase n=1 Tax=Shewanella surugensis TaxID=212020 RepID=A0ABT0LGL8_9GAMM|nr:D-2-hydroxyacid dehydrogenase [Shewanella surugensis]MCL1126857.1 D-2-hydroxyacid dehydrogenase [Shewanella surugensis]